MNPYERILIGVTAGWCLATIEFTYKLNKETAKMIKEREAYELNQLKSVTPKSDILLEEIK
jgi:hypothetical protein